MHECESTRRLASESTVNLRPVDWRGRLAILPRTGHEVQTTSILLVHAATLLRVCACARLGNTSILATFLGQLFFRGTFFLGCSLFADLPFL